MYAIFLVAVYYCSYLSQYLVKINTAFHFQDKEEMELECEERKALQLKLVRHIYLISLLSQYWLQSAQLCVFLNL